MKKTGFLAATILFCLLAGSVHAANICDVDNQLPAYPSVNGSMLLVIPESEVDSRLSSLSEPMKILWQPVDFETYNYFGFGGSMRRFNGCWICELTGKQADFEGMCGPTPFTKSGQFRVDFRAMDFTHTVEFNRTMVVYAQKMSIGTNIDSDGVVHITADTPTSTKEVWITLYDAEDGDKISNYDKVNLTESQYAGRYLIDIDSLSAGAYYASFGFRTEGGETGGDIVRFEIGSETVELTAKTDKTSYFIGEDVIISGQTKYSQVSASVETPSGKTESLGSNTVVNQQYSFEFHITGSEDGDYEVTVTAGGKSSKKIFPVEELINVYPLSLTFDVTDFSTILKKNVTILNTGNDSLALSASTEDITSHVTTKFGKTSLAGSSATTLTVTVSPSALATSTAGKVLISAGDDVSIPVDVTLNVNVQGGTTTEGAGIRVSPGLWKEEDCLVNVPVSYTFTVQSLSDAEINDFDYESTGVEVTDVTLPSSVNKDSFGSLTIEVTPETEKTSGTIEITSSGGSAIIYVNMECASDRLEDDISTLESDVDSLKIQFSDAGFEAETINNIFYYLETELDSASSSLESEWYSSAKESYMSSQARYETLDSLISELDSLPSAGSDDGSWVTWVTVIIVIVILASVGFVLYNKFGSRLFKKGESQDEETIDEELY